MVCNSVRLLNTFHPYYSTCTLTLFFIDPESFFTRREISRVHISFSRITKVAARSSPPAISPHGRTRGLHGLAAHQLHVSACTFKSLAMGRGWGSVEHAPRRAEGPGSSCCLAQSVHLQARPAGRLPQPLKAQRINPQKRKGKTADEKKSKRRVRQHVRLTVYVS